MEKYNEMKSFRLTYLEYSRSHTEMSSSSMLRQLQVLGVLSDVSVFDPDTSEAAEFYVVLHELLSSLEPRSGLTWCAIGVLQHACRNPAARNALIHTYKFTPILTRLLGSNLMLEKQLRVLELLQQLTYGVKISWQEAHLPSLMKTLTQWIVGDERALVDLSLSVLVNLCYKNLPAVYTLMRTVDQKQFLRSIFKLQNDSVNTRVQVCKLLIILEHISGKIPDADILNFANVTFTTIGEAFSTRDNFLMRHIVDFFKDVSSNQHSREVLLGYENFHAGTERLLNLLNDDAEPECVGMLFEFITSVLSLNVPTINQLYTRIVALAMRWIRTELACTHALSVIRIITVDANGCSAVSKDIMDMLGQGLDVFLLMLDSGGDSLAPSVEARSRLTALVRLLKQMCSDHILRCKLLTLLRPDAIRNIFQPLILEEATYTNNLLEIEVTKLYVHTLDLLACLAPSHQQWHDVNMGMLQHKQIQMVLAVALLTGDLELRKQVLTMTKNEGFCEVSSNALAQSLCDLEPLTLTVRSPNSNVTTAQSSQDMMPLFGVTQEGRLDEFIVKLETALQRNDIKEISTSAVMELYEYKLAALGHSERALQSSLEAASNHSTHLQHRLAQVSAEASRLHQLLFHNQQCLEGVRSEKRDIDSRLEKANKHCEVVNSKNHRELQKRDSLLKEMEGNIVNLQETITAKNAEIEDWSQRCESHVQKLSKMDECVKTLQLKISDQASIFADAKKNMKIMEERIEKRETMIRTKSEAIQVLEQNIISMKKEVHHLNLICKGQERSLSEKDSELSDVNKQLEDLQRIRDAIFDIAKKKSDK